MYQYLLREYADFSCCSHRVRRYYSLHVGLIPRPSSRKSLTGTSSGRKGSGGPRFGFATINVSGFSEGVVKCKKIHPAPVNWFCQTLYYSFMPVVIIGCSDEG